MKGGKEKTHKNELAPYFLCILKKGPLTTRVPLWQSFGCGRAMAALSGRTHREKKKYQSIAAQNRSVKIDLQAARRKLPVFCGQDGRHRWHHSIGEDVSEVQ